LSLIKSSLFTGQLFTSNLYFYITGSQWDLWVKMRKNTKFYIINAITTYRLVMAPVLMWFAFEGNLDYFKWLLIISFGTDAIDGFLARKYKVSSVSGAKLDSIADDLTVVAALIGMFAFRPEFAKSEVITFVILLILFVIQTLLALIFYRKLTSYHTYLAKLAAVLQGVFFILFFLLNEPLYPLFYAAAIVTGLQLIEETILILYLRQWQADVKGLYWVLRKRRP
jgi:phosphatidylglycerophosphate synthase